LHGQDEREFQIELANVQMKHKTKLFTFFGVVVLEFSLFWVVGNLLFAPINQWQLVATVGMIIIGAFVLLLFWWDLKDIEKEAQALRKKYTWQ